MFIEATGHGSGGDSWSYKSCKAPVKSSPPTNQQPNWVCLTFDLMDPKTIPQRPGFLNVILCTKFGDPGLIVFDTMSRKHTYIHTYTNTHTQTDVITVSMLHSISVHKYTAHLCLFGCASGCVVECRTYNREVVGSNLGWRYFTPRSTQPSIPLRSPIEYQLRLGRQRQVWLISLAD